jgi:Ca2+-dependent lipid-binding protein
MRGLAPLRETSHDFGAFARRTSKQDLTMTKLIQEIKDDFDFVKSHTLQPKWYKVLKVFILAGFLAGYYFLFGRSKTIVFSAVFLFLSLLVHLLYRAKTNKWKRSWLDFVVAKEGDETKAERIGKYYYSAIILNAILSVIVSQVVP